VTESEQACRVQRPVRIETVCHFGGNSGEKNEIALNFENLESE